MRRSSSTTSTWGASSASVAGAVVMLTPFALPWRPLDPLATGASILAASFAARAWRSAALAAHPIGAGDEAQHRVALVGIDHGGEKPAGFFVRARAEVGERARNTRGLQAGELHGQPLPFGS